MEVIVSLGKGSHCGGVLGLEDRLEVPKMGKKKMENENDVALS